MQKMTMTACVNADTLQMLDAVRIVGMVSALPVFKETQLQRQGNFLYVTGLVKGSQSLGEITYSEYDTTD